MASLYELSTEYTAVLDAYDAAETEEEREVLWEQLDGLCFNLSEKAEAYAKLIRNKTSDAKAFREEAKRLTARAQADENLVERLKEALMDAMKMTDTQEIETSIGKWRLQSNPVSAEVVDWTKLPKEYRTPQPDKVDKAALIRHYKETGEVFDGVEFKQEQGIRFR